MCINDMRNDLLDTARLDHTSNFDSCVVGIAHRSSYLVGSLVRMGAAF